MKPDGKGGEAWRAAERAARHSYGRLVALLCAGNGDVAGAEDALADAFAAALSQWPGQGVPRNADAWLLSVARRRRLDAVRRQRTRTDSKAHLALMREELEADADSAGEIPDQRLALMFACAHPAIERSIRAPLMLQILLGLTAAEIASAFLSPPKAMGQRLVRAKAGIKKVGPPLAIPARDELAGRLDAVLEAVYATYFRGWEDCGEAGASALAEEAIWLGRVIVSLLPGEPEAAGVLSLMLFAEARRPARRGPAGAYVPLDDQDTGCWNLMLIDEAEALLLDASRAGATGRFQIEAAIQSAHVARRLHNASNADEVARLYDILVALVPSPVVALNRALARAKVDGPDAALFTLDQLASDRRLADYQPYWAARGQLCLETGRHDAAREALQIAIGLSTDPAVRAYLRGKLEELGQVRAC